MNLVLAEELSSSKRCNVQWPSMICLSVLIFVILAVAALFCQFLPTTSPSAHYEATSPVTMTTVHCRVRVQGRCSWRCTPAELVTIAVDHQTMHSHSLVRLIERCQLRAVSSKLICPICICIFAVDILTSLLFMLFLHCPEHLSQLSVVFL